jgi:hypothetical protein
MRTLGRWTWNVMAVIGILTITSIILTVAGLVAVFND